MKTLRRERELFYGMTWKEVERCIAFVEALAVLPYQTGANYDEEKESQDRVLALVRAHRINVRMFTALDEKPGWHVWGGYRSDYPGASDPERYKKRGEDGWHWKLRRCRNNPGSGLFKALARDRMK